MGHKLKSSFLIILIGLLFLHVVPGWAEESTTNKYSLEDCLNLAYQNSEEMKTATLKVSKAGYEVKQAEAGFLPSLDYDIYKQDSRASTDNYSYYEDYGALSLNQSLYTGGKLSATLKQARLDLENALEDQRQAKQQLTYDVKEAFYQLWLAMEELKVAQTSYENMEQHFHNTQQKFEEGTVSQYELLEAEVNWKKLKPDVIAAQNEVSLYKLNLGILIGINGNQPLEIEAEAFSEIVLEKIDLTLEKALETAYLERPEMRQQKNEIENAQLEIKIAKANYYPTLALSGSYQGSKSGGSSDADWEKVWALKLDLSGTLFNGGETQAKVAAAQKEVQVQLSSEKQLRDTIRLNLEKGLQSLANALETIEANKANIDLAKEALRLTQIQLEEGMATTTDLMDAQLDVDEALDGYYEGLNVYLTALANLDLLLGKDF